MLILIIIQELYCLEFNSLSYFFFNIEVYLFTFMFEYNFKNIDKKIFY